MYYLNVIVYNVIFPDMAEEAATPGGLNAQSVTMLKGTPHFDVLNQVCVLLFVIFIIRIVRNNFLLCLFITRSRCQRFWQGFKESKRSAYMTGNKQY